jgi:phage tail sheath protein FI
MPEYLHPGVYVVEVDAHATPIPGVSTSTEAFVDSLLALARERIRGLPGWTDYNVHDPGITLLELLAWAADSALFRRDRIGEREAGHLSRAIASSLALLQRAQAPASPIARTCFLEGRTIESLGLCKGPEHR